MASLPIGAIVLAAGGSTRLGQSKQLLKYADGETLVHSVARGAHEAGCKPICVVTGKAHDQVAPAVADLALVVVRNENWESGIGSSIRLGLAQLVDLSAAVVLLACDQPAVGARIICAAIEQHNKTGRPIIASRYANTLGIPALFDRSVFRELEQLDDGSGAKGLIEGDLARVAAIEFPGGAIDVDSPEDLHAWRRAQRTEPARY
jgi:molybdenum cofactor cytidylyltransferase